MTRPGYVMGYDVESDDDCGEGESGLEPLAVGDKVCWQVGVRSLEGATRVYPLLGIVRTVYEWGDVDVQFDGDEDYVVFTPDEQWMLERGWPDGWDEPDYSVED